MSELTHGELTRVLDYNQESGVFTWRIRSSARAQPGSIAGSVTQLGYLTVKYLGVYYKAHRLAWFYVHGNWPVQQIDHINGDKLDNRICNLRDVSPRVNLQNMRRAMPKNKTGLLGVACQASGKFSAKITVDGKPIHIGTFPTPEMAHAAYLQAKRLMHEGCTI